MRKSAVESVHRRSLDERAADSIRQSILTGRMKPGERITEIPLSEELGLSRGTTRAALRKLAHEGLIVQEPYKGYEVRSLTSQGAWELYTLRSALEGLAAKLVTERMNEGVAAELESIFKNIETFARQGNRAKTIEADFAFHRRMITLSGHHLLQAHYDMIEQQMRLYFALVGRYLPLEAYIPAHRDLVKAIVSGDVDSAFALATEHNRPDGEIVVEELRKLEENAAD